jgi:hypothetical protein
MQIPSQMQCKFAMEILDCTDFVGERRAERAAFVEERRFSAASDPPDEPGLESGGELAPGQSDGTEAGSLAPDRDETI